MRNIFLLWLDGPNNVEILHYLVNVAKQHALT